MTMPTPVTKEYYDGFDILRRYQPVTAGTMLDIYRNTAGNELPGSEFQATLAEARRNRWFDTMSGTMECRAAIADEHAPAYFDSQVDWLDGQMVVHERVDIE